jgi:hypothetical protein
MRGWRSCMSCVMRKRQKETGGILERIRMVIVNFPAEMIDLEGSYDKM